MTRRLERTKTCCYPLCRRSSKQNDPSVSFFYFPKSSELRSQWTKRLNIPHFKPGRRTFVCSDHFTMDCFSVYPFADQSRKFGQDGKLAQLRRRLIRGSVPTLFKRTEAGWVDGSEDAPEPSSESSCSTCPLDKCPLSFRPESAALEFSIQDGPNDVPSHDPRQGFHCNGACAAQLQSQTEEPCCGQKRPRDRRTGDYPLTAEGSADALLCKRCRVDEEREVTRTALQKEVETFPQQLSLRGEMRSTSDLPFQEEMEFDQQYRQHAQLDYGPYPASFDYCSDETDNVPLDLSYPSISTNSQRDGVATRSHAKSPGPRCNSAYKHLSKLLAPSLTVEDERDLGSPSPVQIPQYGCPCFPDFVRCVSTQGQDGPTKVTIKQEASDDYHSDEGHRVSPSRTLLSPIQVVRTQPTGPVETMSTGDEDIALRTTPLSIKRESKPSESAESVEILPPSSPAKVLNIPTHSPARFSNNSASKIEEILKISECSPTEIMNKPASSPANYSDTPAFRRAGIINNLVFSPPAICNGPASNPAKICNDVTSSPAEILNSSVSRNASVPPSTASSPEKDASYNEGAACARKEHRRRLRQRAESERDFVVSASEKTKVIKATSVALSAVSSSSQTSEPEGSCSVEKNQTYLTSKASCPQLPRNAADPRNSLPSPLAVPSHKSTDYVSSSGETEEKRSERSNLSSLSKFYQEPDAHPSQPYSIEDDELAAVTEDPINTNSDHTENQNQTTAAGILQDRFSQTVAKSSSKSSEKVCEKNASIAVDRSDVSRHLKESMLRCGSQMGTKNSSDPRKASHNIPPASILISPFSLPSLPVKNQTISVLITEGDETRVPASQIGVKPRKKSTKPSSDRGDLRDAKELMTRFTKPKRDCNNLSAPFPYRALVITNEGLKPVLQVRLDNSQTKPVVKSLSSNAGRAICSSPARAASLPCKQRKSESCSVTPTRGLNSSVVGPSVSSNKTRSSVEPPSPQLPPQLALTTVPQLELGKLPSAKEHLQRWSGDPSDIPSGSSLQPTSTSTISSLSLDCTEMGKVSPTAERVPVTRSIARNSTESKINPPDKPWHGDHLQDFEEKSVQPKGVLATVVIRQEHIVQDVFRVYKDNIDKVPNITFILVNISGAAKESRADPGNSKLGRRVSLKGLLSKFWKRCAICFFEGDEQKVPKTEMSSAAAVPDDVPFQLGKILRHGLMACGYWPVMLSVPCAVYVLTGKRCSDSLLHDCLRKVMFEFEVMALDDLQDAAAHDSAQGEGSGHRSEQLFDLIKMEERVSLVLRLYGGEHCKVPERLEVSRFLKELASYYLHFRPYWWLREMRRGFLSLEDKEHALLVVEAKVLELYHKLEPTPQAVLRRMVFTLGSSDKEEQDKEKRSKWFLKRSLFRLGREDLSRLLTEWSEVDCLLDDKYYVTFTSTTPSSISRAKNPNGLVFHPEKCTLVLSTSWSSFDVFYSTLIRRIRGAPDVGAQV